MLEKGSFVHQAGIRMARMVVGSSKLDALNFERVLLSIALIEPYNAGKTKSLEKIKERLEYLEIEMEIAKMRQGFWGRLQDKIAEEDYMWCE